MQYTYATSAYHEAKFLVHFHLAIWASFERGATEIPPHCTVTTLDHKIVNTEKDN